jgi:hypothetical protein
MNRSRATYREAKTHTGALPAVYSGGAAADMCKSRETAETALRPAIAHAGASRRVSYTRAAEAPVRLYTPPPRRAHRNTASRVLRAVSRLHPDDVEAIARRVAELLRAPTPVEQRQLVDAAALAAALGVGRAFVYEHSEQLGAVRLGEGKRARLRFDLEAARAAMPCSGSSGSQATSGPMATGDRSAARPRRMGRRAARVPEPGGVLAVRGDAMRSEGS